MSIQKILSISNKIYKQALWSYFLLQKEGFKKLSQTFVMLDDEEEENIYNYDKNNIDSIRLAAEDISDKIVNENFYKNFLNYNNAFDNLLKLINNLSNNIENLSIDDVDDLEEAAAGFEKRYRSIGDDGHLNHYLRNDIDDKWEEQAPPTEFLRIIQDMYSAIRNEYLQFNIGSLSSDPNDIASVIQSETARGGSVEVGQEVGQMTEKEVENVIGGQFTIGGKSQNQEEAKKRFSEKRNLGHLSNKEQEKIYKEFLATVANTPGGKDVRRILKFKMLKNPLTMNIYYFDSKQALLKSKREFNKKKREKLKNDAASGDPEAQKKYEAYLASGAKAFRKFYNFGEKFTELSNKITEINKSSLELNDDDFEKEMEKINYLIRFIESEINNLSEKDQNTLIIKKEFNKFISQLNKIKIKRSRETAKRGRIKVLKEVIDPRTGEVEKVRDYENMNIAGYKQNFRDDIGKERNKVKETIIIPTIIKLIEQKLSKEDDKYKELLIQLIKIKIKGKTLTSEDAKNLKGIEKAMQKAIVEDPSYQEYEKIIKELTGSSVIEKFKDPKNLSKIRLSFKNAVRKLKQKIEQDVLNDNKKQIQEVANSLNILFNENNIKETVREIFNLLESSEKSFNVDGQVEFEKTRDETKISELSELIEKRAREYDPIKDIARSVKAYEAYALYFWKMSNLESVEESLSQDTSLNELQKKLLIDGIEVGKKIQEQFGRRNFFTKVPTPGRETQFKKQTKLLKNFLNYLEKLFDINKFLEEEMASGQTAPIGTQLALPSEDIEIEPSVPQAPIEPPTLNINVEEIRKQIKLKEEDLADLKYQEIIGVEGLESKISTLESEISNLKNQLLKQSYIKRLFLNKFGKI